MRNLRMTIILMAVVAIVASAVFAKTQRKQTVDGYSVDFKEQEPMPGHVVREQEG